jgi:hypothetical protein
MYVRAPTTTNLETVIFAFFASVAAVVALLFVVALAERLLPPAPAANADLSANLVGP